MEIKKAGKGEVTLKKKTALLIVTAAFLIGVAACGNGNTTSSSAETSNRNSMLQQTDVAENSSGTENTEGLTFADLSKYQFEFCSGAGGWATDFTIEPDGTKYIYSDAYGLTGTDTFLVYMEGTPVSKISEDAYSWLAMANQSDTELTMTTLVNEGQGEGIYSFERTIDSDR